MGHTKESTRRAAHTNDLITSSPGLKIEKLTTAELWASPPILPEHKNVHLVILTHGLHSNVTADMLYLKERIEQTAGIAHRPDGGVVVRGYSGNVCKTERGIKWLGRRMGRWLLQETLWLEQVGCFAPDAPPYSRISFVGHSLGGVVQNFAIAFIEVMTKGEFFQKLRPVRLITLAAPWLGVSAENPAYVKLALDVGLIGRTGQDLGLMNRLGQRFDNLPDKKQIRDSRPILRLLALPNSPAHRVIRRFSTRTIYANVVNDGIVPLRTSAMFFLDWNSFDTVEKSITQNGVMTHLGSLPGIVGLPTFDNFRDGVERIFSPRKSESDDTKSTNDRSSNERSSNEESRPQSQSFVASFLRRKSAHVVPTSQSVAKDEDNKHSAHGNQRGRGQSVPPMRENSFDVAKDVAEAMEDNMRTPIAHANSAAEGEELRKELGAWNEERRGDDDKKHGQLTISGTRDKRLSSGEKRHPGNIISSHTPHVSGEHHSTRSSQRPEPIGMNTASPHSASDLPNSRSGIMLVESPSETTESLVNPAEEPPSTQPEGQTATGPPQDEDPAQGDNTSNPLFSIFQHFRPMAGRPALPRKLSKVYHRSQTVSQSSSDVRPPPPRTTFFESFPSLINPPLPDEDFITHPSCRPKTIFHDRLYTSEDIPPVSLSSPDSTNGTDEQNTKREKLRLEEKIARDWHSDMTWRKVLVKLEPDAHNNIIVRRMFPNAYGWPVIEHLVREHFKRDPEGLQTEFTQEIGFIPLEDDEGASSPTWDSPLMDSDDELDKSTLSEKPESVGRALMSDEESGDVVEMTEFPASKDDAGTERGNVEIAQGVNKGAPLDMHFT